MTVAPQTSILLRSFSPHAKDSWADVLTTADMYERVGIDRLVVSDHVVFGETLEDYGRPEMGGVSGGRQPTGPDGHWLEPLTVLTAVAARTSTIRLGTSILLAALRRPVVLAKAVATLDVISGGRVDLGVGVGWQKAEYEAAGLSFSQRGRLLDETLDVCARFWTEPVVEISNEPIHQMPKPLQPGGVPIWVSGRSTNRAVIRRVARFGSGWIPWGDDADDPGPGIERLRAALEDAGRGDVDLQVTSRLPDDRARFENLMDAGVTDFRITGVPLDETALAETVARVREWSVGTESA